VNYGKNGAVGHCQFIIPLWCPDIPEGQVNREYNSAFHYIFKNEKDKSTLTDGALPDGAWQWMLAMADAEDWYNTLSEQGWTQQQARSVLPNSTKTEIVTTANLREWRHILKLRTSSNAHPQIREVMLPLLNEFKKHLPELFDDIEVK
jgi:thymidylate synthase ThyX